MEIALYAKWLILLGVFLIFGIILYNLLIRKRNNVVNAFSTIDVMLKKRFDLIPNLVTAVKQYAGHEKELFTEIARLRSLNYYSFTDAEKEAFDATFTRAQDRFNIIAENYPQLKASDNFMQLQRSLNETEEQLAAARRTYNAMVTTYNNSVQVFPSNLMATLFGFKCKMLFHIPEHEQQVPEIKDI